MYQDEIASAFHNPSHNVHDVFSLFAAQQCQMLANAGLQSLELHPTVDLSKDPCMRHVKLVKEEGLVIPGLTAAVLVERR